MRRLDVSIQLLLLCGLLLLANAITGAPTRDAAMGDWLGGSWKSTVIIDAGSTGSRVHIYQYKMSRAGLATVKQPFSSYKVTPGLSDYADQPQSVGESLGPLLEYAYKLVPSHQQISTEVHLFATAGFRILSPRAAADLIESCRSYLAISRFKFKPEWATVMSGNKEGVYGWVAANYASGALQGYALKQGLRLKKPSAPSAPFVGVFELGGASAQVTFCPELPTVADNMQLLTLPNLRLPLYTHSFLGFGQEAALTLASTAAVGKRLQAQSNQDTQEQLQEEEAEDPCLPLGYRRVAPAGAVVGSGDFEQCRAIAKGLIAGQCQDELCPIGDSMPVELQGPFIAMENFHYTAQFLGLSLQPSLQEIALAGQDHCALAWPALQQRHGANVSVEHLLHFCFSWVVVRSHYLASNYQTILNAHSLAPYKSSGLGKRTVLNDMHAHCHHTSDLVWGPGIPGCAAYIVALLHDGFKLGMQERRLRFTNYVEDPQGKMMDVDWTLGAVVVQTALMQSSAASSRSFLQPYDDGWQDSSRFTEHTLAALAIFGFVAAFAVRIAGKSRWLWRMLRKHAGGTKGLMVLEHGLDSVSDKFPTKSTRRLSKPG